MKPLHSPQAHLPLPISRQSCLSSSFYPTITRHVINCFVSIWSDQNAANNTSGKVFSLPVIFLSWRNCLIAEGRGQIFLGDVCEGACINPFQEKAWPGMFSPNIISLGSWNATVKKHRADISCRSCENQGWRIFQPWTGMEPMTFTKAVCCFISWPIKPAWSWSLWKFATLSHR